MLSAVATKLSGSRAVGFWAAIVWTLNSAIATPLVWTAVYYELAWPFWLLTMFWLLLRYDETGERRFFIAQCVMFVLGFFVLEMNVVYPAIAAAYAIPHRQTSRVAQESAAAVCAFDSLHRDPFLFRAASIQRAVPDALGHARYSRRWFNIGAGRWGRGRAGCLESSPLRFAPLCVWSLTGGLLAFLIFAQDAKRLLLPAWFLIALAPLLPLRDHMTDEYLTAPTLGLAIWAGWAMVSGWRANQLARVAAVLLFIALRRLHDPFRPTLRAQHFRAKPSASGRSCSAWSSPRGSIPERWFC